MNNGSSGNIILFQNQIKWRGEESKNIWRIQTVYSTLILLMEISRVLYKMSYISWNDTFLKTFNFQELISIKKKLFVLKSFFNNSFLKIVCFQIVDFIDYTRKNTFLFTSIILFFKTTNFILQCIFYNLFYKFFKKTND